MYCKDLGVFSATISLHSSISPVPFGRDALFFGQSHVRGNGQKCKCRGQLLKSIPANAGSKTDWKTLSELQRVLQTRQQRGLQIVCYLQIVINRSRPKKVGWMGKKLRKHAKNSILALFEPKKKIRRLNGFFLNRSARCFILLKRKFWHFQHFRNWKGIDENHVVMSRISSL